MNINRDINSVLPGIRVLTGEIRWVLDEGRTDEETVHVNTRYPW